MTRNTAFALLLLVTATSAFTPSIRPKSFTATKSTSLSFLTNFINNNDHEKIIRQQQQRHLSRASFIASRSPLVLQAGGFEWEDPEDALDQGVDNPFKKTDDASDEDEGSLKIDPARLLAPRLQGANLYFIGMMGSGKSSIGDKIARRMGTYNFLDTDHIIESATNMTIPQIFAAEGEDGFREAESSVLNSIYAYIRCVVSTGGGIVCSLKNWSKLQTGIVVWLDVDPELIMKRIEGSSRPLLQTDDPLQTLKDLTEERRGKYEQCDLRVEVEEGMSEDETVDVVIKELHNFIDDNPPAYKMAKAKAQAEGLDWVE